jgi:protein-S-isoprenylcysteine O-methyltransferase Ste14
MTKLIAWLGGAWFVASLTLTAWWYFAASGQPRPFAGWTPLAIDTLLVTLFAGHHSLFAREPVKRALTFIPAPLLRSSYVWVASLLLILVLLLWQPIGGTLYAVTGPSRIVNAVVQALGLIIIARSVSGLDPLELAGIRQVIAARNPEPFQALQISGPYRWVRHPLYLGWIVALFATARMTGDRLAFATLTSLYLVLAIPLEERSLRQSFGDDYARYAVRVPWRVFPYVY